MVITIKDASVAAINANEKWDNPRKKGPIYITIRLPNLSLKYPENGEPMMVANPMTGKIKPTFDMGIPRMECK